jgi:proteasome accessory factor C
MRKDVLTLADVETPGQLGFYLVDLDLDALEHEDEVRLKIGAPVTVPLHFTEDDVLPLLAGLKALADSDFVTGIPDRAAVVAAALEKLEATAGPGARAIDLRLPPAPNAQVAALIASAIARGRRLAIDYVNSDDTVTTREVDPVVVITQDRHNYLRAWCYYRNQPRVFRLDRILSVVELPLPIDRQKVGAVTRASDIAAEAASAGTLVAELTLSPPARWVAEEIPGEITDLPDGSFIIKLKAASPAWLESLLLGIAPHVLRVEPVSLATRVADAAHAALSNY